MVLDDFFRDALYIQYLSSIEHETENSATVNNLVHSKYANWLIANDENDSSTANYIAEGVDAIDGSIPMTFLHLATIHPITPGIRRKKNWIANSALQIYPAPQ